MNHFLSHVVIVNGLASYPDYLPFGPGLGGDGGVVGGVVPGGVVAVGGEVVACKLN